MTSGVRYDHILLMALIYNKKAPLWSVQACTHNYRKILNQISSLLPEIFSVKQKMWLRYLISWLFRNHCKVAKFDLYHILQDHGNVLISLTMYKFTEVHTIQLWLSNNLYNNTTPYTV